MGRILIADDHDSLRRGLAQALAEAGHDVEEAPHGNNAQRCSRELPQGLAAVGKGQAACGFRMV